tara:strand:- start:901 stop:1710 length:810 start_codon:yes stop_codon:yes gene_type:complete
MFNNNVSIIFDENPISRAYLNLLISKNYQIKNIIYLGDKNIFPKMINQYLKFHKNNYYAIRFLKKKNIDYFLSQVEEFFNFKKNFIREMYKFNNLNIFKVFYVKNNNINSEKLKNFITEDNSDFFLNTGKQILKSILETRKKFIHIHPAYLPLIRGADGSLHSIAKYNQIASTSFFINSDIDKGKIIFRTKKKFIKFKLKDKDDYNLRELYNLWFCFVDPLIRAEHLKTLFEIKEPDEEKIKVDEYQNSNYYTFMKDLELEQVVKKIFL